MLQTEAIRRLVLLLVLVCCPAPESSAQTPISPRDALELVQAATLQARADSLWAVGLREAATVDGERALELRRSILGGRHRLVALQMDRVGWYYREQGRWTEAESLFWASLHILESIHKRDNPDYISPVRNLSNLIQERGRYDEAEPLFRRLIELQRAKLGPDHVDVANSLNNLGNNCRNQGHDEEAGDLFLAALRIREKAHGTDDADVGASMNNLAVHYQDQGRYADAEPLNQKAAALFERVLGADHPYVSASLRNQAMLCVYQGRYVEAESLLRRSERISIKAMGRGHQDVAWVLQDRASLYELQGRYDEAAPLLKHALTILKAALGAEHPEIGKTLTYLGALARDRGAYPEAERFFHDAQTIFRKGLSPKHPNVAYCLDQLGRLELAKHRYAEAESLLQRSVSITASTFGEGHPDYAAGLGELAACYAATNRGHDAMKALTRSMAVEQDVMGQVFRVSSEPAMRDYLAKVSTSLDRIVSLARADRSVPGAADSALAWTLRRKTAVLEAVMRFRQARRMISTDSSTLRLSSELYAARVRLDQLITDPIQPGQAASFDSQIAATRRIRDRLEAQFNRRISEQLQHPILSSVGVEDVKRALPRGAALVEFVRFRSYDFRASRLSDRYGTPHYVAMVLTRDRETRMIDLGRALEIDREIERFRRAMDLAGTDPQPLPLEQLARTLYRKVFAPIQQALAGVRTVYLAPDGELNRVPFEALLVHDNQYLIERYRVAYLTSGKDLLEPATPPSRGTVVFASPDFNLGARTRLEHSERASVPSQGGVPLYRGSRSMEASRWRGWSELPAAMREAEDIRRELSSSPYGPVQVLSGSQALEEQLKTLPAPRLLHIATHGYFFPDQTSTRGKRRVSLENMDAPGRENRLSRIQGTENPLIRSGFVLAGANVSRDLDSLGLDDGWVSAEEVGMLDLHGTEMVILSGCDTGLGDVRLGEGVSGLRRAFRYAGARTLIMSLAPIGDEPTRMLMRRFYAGLAGGKGKLDALRQAQLFVLRERRNRTGEGQPWAWANFVLVGDSD